MELHSPISKPLPCSPHTDTDLNHLLNHKDGNGAIILNQLPVMCMSFNRITKLFLRCCSMWILLALLWIHWPVYHHTIYPFMAIRLRDQMQVEPFIVVVALVLPFLLLGVMFYWNQIAMGSVLEWRQPLKHFKWFQSHFNSSGYIGLDAVDVVVIGGFLLVQFNIVIGKLLVDRTSGKLAQAGYFNRTARAFGMNELYSIVLSVILVARQSFLHKLFGLSRERATRYHLLTGHFGFLLLLLHGVMYIMIWYVDGKVLKKLYPCLEEGCSLKQRYKSTQNWFGLLALGFLSIVAMSSMEWARRRFFRRFIALHCLNVFVVGFTVFHYYAASFWLIPAIVVYSIYRLVSAFGRGMASVVSVSAMSNKYLQLELRRSISVGSDFLPGQCVYIKVDAIGNEWHPFTISSSPLRNRHSFVLDVKVQGSFTSQLLTLMELQQLDTVHVDGYYGSEIKLVPHMVFVAGGSGMTPFLSVLDHLKALADVRDRDEMLTENVELPRTLWVVWTCRELEFVEAYAELLDAVNRCSQWKCKMWLHFTHPDRAKYESEDDDCQTEPDDLSEESSPHARRFYPASLNRHAFSGHSYMLGLPLFVGAALGCLVLMLWVLQLKEFSSKSLVRRFLLLNAGALGAVLGATFVLSFVRRNARKTVRGSDNAMDIAMNEMESVSLDVPSLATPCTPCSIPKPAHDLLESSFLIAKERPDLRSRLRIVHREIRESYGMKAEVALLVSGPADLQHDALLAARDLVKPAFVVHQKSFLL